MKSNWLLAFVLICTLVLGNGSVSARPNFVVGEQVHQITVPVPGSPVHCSIGLAFDGTSLYYNRCSDSNIYIIDPISGELQNMFDTGIAERPNAMAFDRTRNGIWIGAQSCNSVGMPIYFWDLDNNTVTHAFDVPFDLINPATDESFLAFCFTDGLAFDANDPTDPDDDEIWFGDDVNRNLGVFGTSGTFLRGYDASAIDPSLDRRSGIAIGGDFLYLANDGGGDVFRADKSTNPLELVDQFTNGDTRQEDMECDPHTFAPIEVMWVRTTPQSGQFPDVITAYEIEPGSCSAGGLPADTDGDGLYDNWESDGYDFDSDGDVDVDLPAMGANPMRKDVFVEIDWLEDPLFHTHRPSENSINRIINAYAIAPVPNPEGPQGITLHVDYGGDTLGDFSQGNPVGHDDFLGSFSGDNYDWTEFDEIKDANFAPEREAIFHYAVFAHFLGRLCGPSGVSRGAPASDFIVALGGYTRLPFNDVEDPDGDICLPLGILSGTDDQVSGTFMHELGHNLGLGHGGGDNINHKPNYLSVMNYSFQFRGLIVNGEEGRFDYAGSSVGVPTLNETVLDEQSGLSGGGIPEGYGTRKFNCNQTDPAYIHVLDANGPIDWDCDGNIDENTVQANVNGDSTRNDFKNDEELKPWSDWAELVYDGGLIGLGASADELPIITLSDEMTPEDAAQIESVPAIQQIIIDIKPGLTPNIINCNKTKTIIPVAILTTDLFDALTVDHTTVSFEGASELHVLKNGPPQRHESDIDGDGDIDLILHFKLGSTSLTCNSTQGTLTGETFDGSAFEATDSLRMIQ